MSRLFKSNGMKEPKFTNLLSIFIRIDGWTDETDSKVQNINYGLAQWLCRETPFGVVYQVWDCGNIANVPLCMYLL